MIKDAEKQRGAVLSDKDDPRVTQIGRLMRKTAIDEIPQLISIFRGDMSWVGPPPERPEFVREYLRDIPDCGCRYHVKVSSAHRTAVAGIRGPVIHLLWPAKPLVRRP